MIVSVCICVKVCVCMCVCTRVCMFVYMCILTWVVYTVILPIGLQTITEQFLLCDELTADKVE